MKHPQGLAAFPLVAFLFAGIAWLAAPPEARADAPAGQVTWAFALMPAWFDPADATGIFS